MFLSDFGSNQLFFVVFASFLIVARTLFNRFSQKNFIRPCSEEESDRACCQYKTRSISATTYFYKQTSKYTVIISVHTTAFELIRCLHQQQNGTRRYPSPVKFIINNIILHTYLPFSRPCLAKYRSNISLQFSSASSVISYHSNFSVTYQSSVSIFILMN